MNGRVMSREPRESAPVSRQINIVLRQAETQPQPEADALPGEVNTPQDGPLSDIFKELQQMVGLDNVKETVREIYALLQVAKFRTDAGLASGPHVLHMVFKGNPGTGKTTVARIIARLLHAMGVLSKGHFTEVERADLVGEYIGHTAQKTRELVKKAMGGILFIDEAYSLARGGEKDFGKEAIDCLVKAMEDNKNQFVLILAGYPEEMDFFLHANPGLPSRFPLQIDFPDYSVEQLMQIAGKMLKERDYVLSPPTEWKMRQHLTQELLYGTEILSNARYVRNLLEKAIRQQAVRLMQQHGAQHSRQELMLLRPEDLRLEKKKG